MMNENAVSVLPSDAGVDEFPVLKAFQQYIDAEQEKARKRILLICSFFAVFLLVVVAVFVILLVNVTQRNQALNDRLVDFAMKERERPQANSPVVVQSASDNSALLALTAKLEEMRKNYEAEKAARKSADKEKADALSAQTSAQDQEIERLKNLLQLEREKVAAEKVRLATEKEKIAAEKARQKEQELEAYRRKRWPELYEPKPAVPQQPTAPVQTKTSSRKRMTDQEIDELLNEVDVDSDKPISYFSDDEESAEEEKVEKTAPPPSVKEPSVKKPYKIPVETIQSQPESRWRIPNL